MHTDIKDFPIEVLVTDRRESEEDILACILGREMGLVETNPTLEERITLNQKIIEVIDNEMKRRWMRT